MRGDRGSLSLELVIVFPVMLMIITAIIQAGLWFHARSLTLGAAQHGVDVARSYDAGLESGADAAKDFLGNQGASTLTNVKVTGSAPATDVVEIVVSGRVISVVPGMPGPTVSASARGPLEHFSTAERP